MNGSMLSDQDAATRAGLSMSMWARLRRRGTGPRYVQVGRRVMFRPEDVDAWIEAQLVEPSPRTAA